MTRLQELSIEKAKGQIATAHVWTSSNKDAKPLSDMVSDMICELQNAGYLGQPQVQYSSAFDNTIGAVIFSAFIMVSKN